MVVQHNLRAMNSNRMLGLTASAQAKSAEKLSSGYKINRAADDAAGLSISEKMRKQIRGLSQASLNASDGISAVQTAEGALNEVQDMLQRMNELAVKAANGTMSEDDRGYIQDEIDQLITEIDRVSETTKFNETYLLKGSKEEIKGAEVSGVVGGGITSGKMVEATIVESRGNIYQNQISSTGNLAVGTADQATFKFKDADGYGREVTVDFTIGTDAEATAKNLVDAINSNEQLSQVFKATAGVNGRFEIESLLTGEDVDGTKSVLDATNPIKFKSAEAAGTYKTQLGTATVSVATRGAYSVAIGKATTGGAAGTNKAAIDLTDGDSITVDGKTFTYDSKATYTEGVNVFSSLEDLQKLLGDDYEVSVDITGTLKEEIYDKNGKTIETIKSDYTSAAVTAGHANYKSAIDTLDTTGLTMPKDVEKPGTVTAAGTAKTYTDLKVNLNIIRKADIAPEVNALNFSLQVGADTSEENKIAIDIQSMSAKSLGIDKVRVDGKDSRNADAAVDVIAKAIQQVSTQRSALGAVQNRLEHTINNLDNVVENTTAAESQIRDTDMATEMVKFSNNNILAQAGQAMLAQANQANQGVLSLLG